jgi:ankyrin repeat protein
MDIKNISGEIVADRELIKFFIEKGADLNTKDNNGKTPISYLEEQGNKSRYRSIINLLKRYGAKE